MAKTGAKRKADVAREEDAPVADDAGDADGNASVDGVAADESAVKTPSKNCAARDAPGSSGGMKMRSGRKKKRHKPNSAADEGGIAVSATPRKRTAKKRADDNEEEDVVVASDKQNGKSNNNNTKDYSHSIDGEELGTENDQRKMPPETTAEATAVVQVAESRIVEASGGMEGEEEANNNHAPSDNGGSGNSLVQLATQNLRLPSRHTPKPAQAAATAPGWESVTPAAVPPPGGRRLLFHSAQKSSAAADIARNTFLMQTRNQQRTTTATTTAETEQTDREHEGSESDAAAESTTTAAALAVESSSLFAQSDKEDAVLYTQAWFLFLLIFLVFGNLAIVMSRDGAMAAEGAWSAWNVRAQGRKLADWYGVVELLVPANVTSAAPAEADENEEGDAEDEDIPVEPEIILETLTVTNPALLSDARAALRARRADLHEVKKLESNVGELRRGMEALEGSVKGWGASLPEINFNVEDDPIKKMVMEEIASSDVVIFSKSYCPHCKATKELFTAMAEDIDDEEEFNIQVIELDTFENGPDVQSVLLDLTGQKTVPNIFVKGRHVGGNDRVQAAAKSGELALMMVLDIVTYSDGEMKPSCDQIDSMRRSIVQRQLLLEEWEWAVEGAEESLDLLDLGKMGLVEVNDAAGALSEVSMIPGISALVLDMNKISVPGEGCEGMDYVPLEPEEDEGEEVEDVLEEEDTVDVVGAIDVNALDFASDAPVRLEDAQTAYQSLLKLAQATSEALVGDAGPSSHAKRWVQQLIQEELQNEGVDGKPPSIDELHQPIVTPEDIAIASQPSDPDDHASYTARDAIRDIDRLLETEDADRTGKFDYASIIHGASIVRRGPYATSYSLYETLPLINRVLAYTKLRFYGHPPEAALLPTFPMHARGQCWSFPSEFSSPRARGQALMDDDGTRGEYATLTVSLTSAITITEIMVEHVSLNVSSDPTTAIKGFRVVGFEDAGAYGEPWELGTFKFLTGPTMQAFSIPTMRDGQNVPKLKSVAIAVDSNWGNADYSCLYRARVHGA